MLSTNEPYLWLQISMHGHDAVVIAARQRSGYTPRDSLRRFTSRAAEKSPEITYMKAPRTTHTGGAATLS